MHVCTHTHRMWRMDTCLIATDFCLNNISASATVCMQIILMNYVLSPHYRRCSSPGPCMGAHRLCHNLLWQLLCVRTKHLIGYIESLNSSKTLKLCVSKYDKPAGRTVYDRHPPVPGRFTCHFVCFELLVSFLRPHLESRKQQHQMELRIT